jgi:hypothetical protein
MQNPLSITKYRTRYNLPAGGGCSFCWTTVTISAAYDFCHMMERRLALAEIHENPLSKKQVLCKM